ncbi:sirohydrochlorin chelatase [Salinicoccus kekensis]|uniref:Sirohydrochlorin ferrochelatase n=1 Tax=Salinicoccus kekensis TaxID=714307 RepID=A0A285UPB4_9STAP|nr:sirohydrochlorin chelatase [Salinicoccus kekensis]SOC43662.1 sirohydrochlorin ferrochelatase [Salinicoccus kekensis]
MLKHLLLAHGTRRGGLNKRLVSHIEDVMAPHEAEFSIAFLESETEDAYTVIGRLIDEGTEHIIITPLLMLPASHLKKDIPEIASYFRSSYPRLKIDIRPALSNHPLIQEIVRQRISEAEKKGATGIAVVAHGNPDYPEAGATLAAFTETLDAGYPAHPMTLYGDPGLEEVLTEIAGRYDHMIIVPLFLYDGVMTDKVKSVIESLNLHTSYEVTPSLDFDPLLGRVIVDHMDGQLM